MVSFDGSGSSAADGPAGAAAMPGPSARTPCSGRRAAPSVPSRPEQARWRQKRRALPWPLAS
eukprot:4572182-Alexandrium_andersonii.AAC.1